MSPEERAEQKRFEKMKKEAKNIKDDKVETMIAFDDDGNVVFTHSDGRDGEVSIGNRNLSDIYGKTLVHNHPNGTAFSPEDLDVAMWCKEVWAVTGEYIQTFKWNNNAWNNPDIESTFGWKREASRFIGQLRTKLKQGEFVDRAIAEWDDSHDYIDPDSMSWNDYTKAVDARATGINQIIRQRMRDYFKNNAADYGFTFSVRRWK